LGSAGAHLVDRLGAVGDLHQLGGAALADADLGLEQLFPLGPAAGVLSLERLQMLAGGDVMLLGFLGGLIALGDVCLDPADERRLRQGDGDVSFGSDRAVQLIRLPGSAFGRRNRGGALL